MICVQIVKVSPVNLVPFMIFQAFQSPHSYLYKMSDPENWRRCLHFQLRASLCWKLSIFQILAGSCRWPYCLVLIAGPVAHNSHERKSRKKRETCEKHPQNGAARLRTARIDFQKSQVDICTDFASDV